MSTPHEGISPIPPAAAWLGWLGLLPFLAGAAGAWLLDEPRRGAALFMLAAYAALILSFLGAVHWGLAIANSTRDPTRTLCASVLPALIGWVALSLPAGGALLISALGFVGVHVLDLRAVAAAHAPRWYLRLRTPLTLAVLLCLVTALAAIVLRNVH